MDISQAQHSLNYYEYQAHKDLSIEEYSDNSSEEDYASPMLIPPSPSRPPSHVSKRFRQLAFSGSQGSSKCNLPSDNEQDVASKPHSGRHVSTSATARARSCSPRRPHSVDFGWHVSTPVSKNDRSRSPRRPHSVEFGRHMSRRPCSVESGQHALSAPVTTRVESRSPRRPQSSGPLFEILSEVKKKTILVLKILRTDYRNLKKVCRHQEVQDHLSKEQSLLEFGYVG